MRRGGRFRRALLRIGLVVSVAVVALVATEALRWPDVAGLTTGNPGSTAFIDRYLERERRAGRSPQLHWRWVAYGRISPQLKRAVLVAEDINFFSHNGFETGELGTAVREAIAERRLPRGASTISQQVAKNLWLSPSRNPWRKLKEALLTLQLEARLDKRRILEIYLNIAEMGPGIYGAEAASEHYFGLSAAELDAVQAAQLAAALSRPSRWHPSSESPGYHRRVDTLLRRMDKARWLDLVI